LIVAVLALGRLRLLLLLLLLLSQLELGCVSQEHVDRSDHVPIGCESAVLAAKQNTATQSPIDMTAPTARL